MSRSGSRQRSPSKESLIGTKQTKMKQSSNDADTVFSVEIPVILIPGINFIAYFFFGFIGLLFGLFGFMPADISKLGRVSCVFLGLIIGILVPMYLYRISGKDLKNYTYQLNASTDTLAVIRKYVRSTIPDETTIYLKLSDIETFEIVQNMNVTNVNNMVFSNTTYTYCIKLKNQKVVRSVTHLPLEKLHLMGNFIGKYQRSIGNLNFHQVNGMLWMVAPYSHSLHHLF